MLQMSRQNLIVNMGKENYEELKNEMESKVKEQLTTGDSFYDFIIFTLNNFVYRYMESPSTGKIVVDVHDNKKFLAVGVETQIMEALKAINPETKKGIIELAKAHAKKVGPQVQYILGCEVLDWVPRSESGKVRVWANVSWDFPNFQNKENANTLEKTIEFDDIMVFRKQLALMLEDVCEVF